MTMATAAFPVNIDARKSETLRDLLATQGRPLPDPVLEDSIARSAVLLDVAIQDDADETRVFLHVAGCPVYDILPVDRNPNACVLELYDTVNLLDGRVVVPENRTLLRKVSVTTYAIEPQFISRVHLDFDRAARPVLLQRDGRIEIVLEKRCGRTGGSDSVREALAAAQDALEHRSRRIDVEAARIQEIAARKQAALTAIAGVYRLSASSSSLETILSESEQTRAELCASAARVADTVRTAISDDRGKLDALAATLCRSKADHRSAITELRKLAAKSSDGMAEDRNQFDRIATAAVTRYEDALARLEGFPGASRRREGIAFASTPSISLQAQTDDFQQTLRLISGNLSPHAPRFTQTSARDNLYVPAVFQAVDLMEIDLSAGAPPRLAATADAPPSETETQAAPEQESELTPIEDEGETADAEQPVSPPVAEAEEKAETPPKSRTITAPQPPSSLATSPVQMKPSLVGGGDPLYRRVTVDFREMELTNVVALLANAAQINVIAGTDVTVAGTVTAYLKDVPLITAIETVLRMNDLGIVEEEGIFRIVPYDQAQAAKRTTRMIHLESGNASEIEKTLSSVAQSFPVGEQVTISSNDTTNTLILSGPEKRIAQIEALARELDVTKPVLPTVTETIKLNYSEPDDIVNIVKGVLTPEGVGTVEADARGRQLIVTDLPIVIEHVRELVAQVDIPVKQVGIEAMVVDAVMRDNSETGVSWLLDLIREHPSPQSTLAPLSDRVNTRGNIVGTLHDLNTGVDFFSPNTTAGSLAFGLLTDSFDLRGAIRAEVASRNAEILANPVVVTTENKLATIDITQEYPYTQLTQSTQGPPVASTAFKNVGITLEVTPRVTHNNDILVDLNTKQSSISGFSADNVPIEEKRVAMTTLRTTDNRTIFIGGLRRVDNTTDIRKLPVLGDVPVLNFMFRSNTINKTHTELLIFLTCHVIEEVLPELTSAHQVEHDKLSDTPRVPDSQRALFRSLIKPGEMRDPAWKWRRTP